MFLIFADHVGTPSSICRTGSGGLEASEGVVSGDVLTVEREALVVQARLTDSEPENEH